MSFGPPDQPPYQQHTYPPLAMPDSVRATQIVVWATAGVSVLHAFAAGSAYSAGYIVGGYFMLWVIALLALFYPNAGGGVRTASIVLAIFQILFALSALSRKEALLGVIPLGAAITVVVLLRRDAADAWFSRPRSR
ncbi:hypothetical protein [Streptomyces cupreus]|uniref:Uncharacterized protein n=1 Tax=Streptomyces cupreus TaxID=2759956 RepID=A0A7X1IY69_9ACTN|nr:hypothetical protein [Streptomyces cupreus]MBC2900763.1 hypothetical protein [Streptomyces cupreus]